MYLQTTTSHPIEVSYHSQTLYHRPRSSPQVTMLLPGGAMRRHYQDQISRGRENKHTNKSRKTDMKRTHKKLKVKKKENIRYFLIQNVMENKILLVCCQSKPQMLGQILQSLQWRETCSALHIDWYRLNSTYYQWPKDKISRHHWQSLPQQDLLFQGCLNKWHNITMESAKPMYIGQFSQ